MSKLLNSIKGVLNFCKFLVIFKSQNFHFKDPIPKTFTSGVAYKFQCELCNESYYGESVRHFAVRSVEYIGISPLTNKKAQSQKDSVVCHHLLNCKYSPSFEDFIILYHENEKYF